MKAPATILSGEASYLTANLSKKISDLLGVQHRTSNTHNRKGIMLLPSI